MVRKSAAVSGICTALVALVVTGCGTSAGGNTSTNGQSTIKQLTIGSQDFSEAQIDDYIIADLIEAKTPIKVSVKQTSGVTSLMHSMMTHNNIQLYVSYDGTAFMEEFHKSYSGSFAGHPDKVYQYVKDQEMKQYGIWVSPPLGYQDTFALAVPQATADKYNLKTDSDAAQYAGQWSIGAEQAFVNQQPIGLKGFESAYNMNFKKVVPMSYNLLYEALAKGSVQAIESYSTDGRLTALKEVPLEDDKSFFPPYNGVVMMNNSAIKDAHLDQVLAPLWNAISTADQTQMNYDVDVLKQTPQKVAHDFLVKKGLISK